MTVLVIVIIIKRADVKSLFLARQPAVGQGLLIHEVSRSHTTTNHRVGHLWKSDQCVAETST